MPTDYARTRTDFSVRRWDAEQTLWVARQAGMDLRKPNLTVPPEFFDNLRMRPYQETLDLDCNLVVQAGWVALLGGIAGTTITNKFGASNGRIGVGTVNTAATYADTKLGGDSGGSSTTSYYKLVNAAPTISTGSTPPTLAFTSVFGTAVANFAWAEFGMDNFTADGVTTTGLGAGFIFFNHGISNQGTKVSGQTWTATATISFGFPSGAGTVS